MKVQKKSCDLPTGISSISSALNSKLSLKRHGDMKEPGATGLRRVGLSPVALAAKEGLALINGTQVSTALLGLTLHGCQRLARAADIAAALSIDGLQGSSKPFDARIHAARPFQGQMTSAANLRALLSAYVGELVWPPPLPLPVDPRDAAQMRELHRRVQAAQLELGL